MGLVYAQITLVNSGDIEVARQGFKKEEDIKMLNVRAMVDSGAYMLAINETIKNQLDLGVKELSQATLADGTIQKMEIVGPIEVRFKNRRTTVDAFVLPGDSEVLLGAIPMEGMDVIIDPFARELRVHPDHPYRAQFSMK